MKFKFIILGLSLLLINIQTNAQENWEIVNSGTTDNLTDVFFIDNNHGWIIGHSGTLLRIRTLDGINKLLTDTLQYEKLNAIHFVNQNVGWIIGNSGLIIKTTDSGNTWLEQSGGQDYYLHDLHFFDEQVGIICGGTGEGRILRTTNGGNQWNEIQFPSYSKTLLSVYFLNEVLGWTAGFGEILYRTTDSGISWDSIAYIEGGIIANSHLDIYFVDSLSGNVVGAEFHGTGNNNGAIYKSSDGGFSWDPVAGVGYGAFKSQHIIMSQIHFIQLETVGGLTLLVKFTNQLTVVDDW